MISSAYEQENDSAIYADVQIIIPPLLKKVTAWRMGISFNNNDFRRAETARR